MSLWVADSPASGRSQQALQGTGAARVEYESPRGRLRHARSECQQEMEALSSLFRGSKGLDYSVRCNLSLAIHASSPNAVLPSGMKHSSNDHGLLCFRSLRK